MLVVAGVVVVVRGTAVLVVKVYVGVIVVVV